MFVYDSAWARSVEVTHSIVVLWKRCALLMRALKGVDVGGYRSGRSHCRRVLEDSFGFVMACAEVKRLTNRDKTQKLSFTTKFMLQISETKREAIEQAK
jgi:hypothetical protein